MTSDDGLSVIGLEAVRCGQNHVKHIPLEYPKQLGCSCERGVKCEDVGKHPLKLNGTIYGAKNAIIDPEESFKIWEQRPRANLGILTGPENCLFVLDVDIDPEKGVDGFVQLEKLEKEHGPLTDTRRVLTGEYEGRRAKQYQFLYPQGYENARWKKAIAPGLEIRAHRNYYVVAPPSMHRSGVRYEYENPEVRREYPPQWLVDVAEQQQTGINLVSEMALKGERHHNIVAIAGMNRHKNIPLDTALNQCLDYNANHCSPAKPEYLVRNAVTDVYTRYEPGCVPRAVRESEEVEGQDATQPKRPLSELRFDRNLQHELCVITEDKAGNEHVKPVPGQIAKYLQEHYFDFITFRDNEQVYYYDLESGLYVPGGESKIKEAAEIIIGDPLTTQSLLQIIEHIKRQTYVDREKVDAINLDRVAIGNGVLNTRTREVVPFSPEQIYLSKWPCIHDASAPTTEIEKYMKSTFHEDDIPWLQEYYGWHLEPSMRYKKEAMLLGPGDNGKTVFENIIMAVIGPENIASISIQDMSNDPYATAELYQKTANIYDDLPAMRVRDTGQFKILSGDGRARAQEKYQKAFYFWNRAKGTYSANKLPGTRDITPAFFLRWMIAEMPHTFVDPTDSEGNPITLGPTERPKEFGIVERMTTPAMMSSWLNYMLDGLDQLRKNDRFSSSKTQDEIRDIWLMQTDPISMFVKESLEKAKGDIVEKKAVYKRYTTWCEENDVTAEKDGEFAKRLPTLISTSSTRPRSGGKRPTCWEDIRLKGDVDSVDPQSQLSGSYETELATGFGQGGQGYNGTTIAVREQVHNIEEVVGFTPDHPDQKAPRAPLEIDLRMKFIGEVGALKHVGIQNRIRREDFSEYVCKQIADEYCIHLDGVREKWVVFSKDPIIVGFIDEIYGGSNVDTR